jgi:hypothetical protein
MQSIPVLALIVAAVVVALVLIVTVVVAIVAAKRQDERIAGTQDPRRTAFWESFGCMYLIFLVTVLVVLVMAAVWLNLIPDRHPLPNS